MTENKAGNPLGSKAGVRVTEAQASRLFGEHRFLSADRVVSAWNGLIGERRTDDTVPPLELSGSQPIHYSQAILEEAARDPAWHLIFDPGFSLRENRAILGTDPDHQPCHLRGNDWWLSPQDEGWVNEKAEPAYHLIRMAGLFSLDNFAKDWDWQETQIQEMDAGFRRVPTRILADAQVSCFLLNGKTQFPDSYIFGPELDSSYCFIVAFWDRSGLNLGHWMRNDWGGYWVSDLCVCLTREFDV
jgi:hypothetical protein